MSIQDHWYFGILAIATFCSWLMVGFGFVGLMNSIRMEKRIDDLHERFREVSDDRRY